MCFCIFTKVYVSGLLKVKIENIDLDSNLK